MRAVFCVSVKELLGYGGHVLGLGAFLALGHGKFYALALFKVAEAIAADGAEVYKHIRTTLAGNETETLVAVKPFDGTLDSFSHWIGTPFFYPALPPGFGFQSIRNSKCGQNA